MSLYENMCEENRILYQQNQELLSQEKNRKERTNEKDEEIKNKSV